MIIFKYLYLIKNNLICYIHTIITLKYFKHNYNNIEVTEIRYMTTTFYINLKIVYYLLSKKL